MPKTKYTFYSPQFMEREKAPGWYTTIGITGLIITLFFIFFLHRYLAAVVTILGVIVLFKYANVKAKHQAIEITQEGITIAKNFHPYEKLAGFWFIGTEDGPTLYLESKKRFLPNLSIPLENKNPEELKNVLSQHLPELPSRGEDILDRVARILRF